MVDDVGEPSLARTAWTVFYFPTMLVSDQGLPTTGAHVFAYDILKLAVESGGLLVHEHLQTFFEVQQGQGVPDPVTVPRVCYTGGRHRQSEIEINNFNPSFLKQKVGVYCLYTYWSVSKSVCLLIHVGLSVGRSVGR